MGGGALGRASNLSWWRHEVCDRALLMGVKLSGCFVPGASAVQDKDRAGGVCQPHGNEPA